MASVVCTAGIGLEPATVYGNGPNSRVKAIAEAAGVGRPSFVGYLAWSAAVGGPVRLLVTCVFFPPGA